MIRAALCVALGLLALSAPVRVGAEDACIALTPETPESLEHYDFDTESAAALGVLDPRTAYRVGEVRVVRQRIFDRSKSEENQTFHRLADRWHADTRERVVRNVLLFEEDATVTVAALAESERLLRAKPYLYDARVLPQRLCGDRLDVFVVTRDVWTLNPRLDFTREGGDSSFGIGLSDPNVFGLGREVSVGYTSDEEREGFDVSYHDPNVAGSRVSLFVFAADTDDGSRQYVDVGQPFYALDAPMALRAHVDLLDQEESLYFRSNEYAEFRRRLDDFALSGGVSRGRTRNGVWRWTGGYRYEDHRFSPLPGVAPPVPFPEDRTFSYPWLGFEFVEDEFETAVNVDRIQRTEDIYLGRRYFTEFGYSSHALGGDDVSRGVFRAGYFDAFHPQSGDLWRLTLDAIGYYNVDDDDFEDTWLRALLSYRHQHNARMSFAGDVRVVFTEGLYEDHQLVIGGEAGMRGYPTGYQEGDRSFDAHFEERYFSDVYLLRLVRLGFAAFVDVGRAWFPGDPSEDDYGVLVDAGFGLRLESTRTRGDQLFHLDFGFPLVDGPETDTVQVSFTVKSQL